MKKRNFTSKLNVKKITIAKLDGDKMLQFAGGWDTKTGPIVGTDKLCDKSKLSPTLCDIVFPKPPPPPTGSTLVGCCTHVNCPK